MFLGIQDFLILPKSDQIWPNLITFAQVLPQFRLNLTILSKKILLGNAAASPAFTTLITLSECTCIHIYLCQFSYSCPYWYEKTQNK